MILKQVLQIQVRIDYDDEIYDYDDDNVDLKLLSYTQDFNKVPEWIAIWVIAIHIFLYLPALILFTICINGFQYALMDFNMP